MCKKYFFKLNTFRSPCLFTGMSCSQIRYRPFMSVFQLSDEIFYDIHLIQLQLSVLD